MSAALGPDGIEVALMLAGGRVSEVRITARRPSGIGRLAQGRSAEVVAALLPRLFALCASAQGAAVVAATAAARGEAVDPRVASAHAAAVLTERMLELLRGTMTALSSPDLAGYAPMLRAVGTAARLFDATAATDAPAAAAAIEQIESGLAALGLIERCLADVDSYARWIEGASPLAALGRSAGEPDPDFGALAVDPLDAADDVGIGARLARCGMAFAARPDIDGRVPETGALARQHRHPLLRSLGTGLWPRLLARLIEVGATPARLRALLAGFTDTDDLVRAASLAPGVGLAAVETARGRLHHLVVLDRAGRIDRLEILAPTEWNFHPQGALARAITGVTLGDTVADRRRIERLIAGFDPCVAARLSLLESADA